MIGDRYYNQDKLVRIKKVVLDRVKVINEISKKEETLDIDYLKENFSKLTPKGHIRLFALQKKDSVRKDVVIIFFDNDVITNQFAVRLGVTSRNIINGKYDPGLFNEIVNNNIPIPGSKVELSWYIDDSYESIKNLISEPLYKAYDELVEEVFETDMKTILRMITNSIDGLYSIIPFDLKLKSTKTEVVQLSNKNLLKLQKLIGFQFKACICGKYDFDVDLTKIKNDFILLRELSTKEVYIFKYIKGDIMIENIKQAFTEDEFNTFMRT